MSIKSAGVLSFFYISLIVVSFNVQASEPGVRDHRDSKVDQTSEPDVRDHRDSKVDQTSGPDVRDHRDSKVDQAIKAVANYKDWMIGANQKGNLKAVIGGAPKSDVLYNLKSLYKKKFLHYEDMGSGGGINIGHTKNASAKTASKSARWGFFPKSKSVDLKPIKDLTAVVRNTPIRYGERIAIAWVPYEGSGMVKGLINSEKKFLRYGKRKTGINLKWSKKPVYEWTVLGGKPGTLVGRGLDKVILFNLKIKQPLIYFDRKRGGNIGWPISRLTSYPEGGMAMGLNPTKDRIKIKNDTWYELMLDDAKPSKSVGNKKAPAKQAGLAGLLAPSAVVISDVARTTLSLMWMDNSDREYGVELYRMDRANGWKFIGLFEERMDDLVRGTGYRSNQDDGLSPGTNYCYRMRAYYGFDRAQVSDFSQTVCTKTNP